MMGRQTLTLLDKATGRQVTVEVDPTWTTEELTNELKRRGIVDEKETIIYLKPSNNGEVGITSHTVQDLLTLQSMGVIPIFDRQLINGVWETCRQKLREFANSKGLHFYDDGDTVAASGYFWSPYDKSGTYIVTFKCPDVPGKPPEVYIMPYPQYVKYDQRFEKSHAAPCCWPESNNRCFWHVQEDIMRDNRDLSLVLELIYNNIIQILQLNRVWGAKK
jgi:metal-sulfur cluster biosynthetic enzyme